MTTEERIAAGLLWQDTPEKLAEQGRAKGRAYDFNHLRPEEREKRAAMLPDIFGSVGKEVWIEPPLYLAFGKTVAIGNHVYVNSGLTLVDDYKITIGNDVMIGPNVTVITTGHPIHYKLRPNGEQYSLPVVIEDGVWIAAGVTICPGVTIGRHSVIGAGSVVLRDVPPDTLAAGNPCRAIRPITDRDLEFYYHDRRVE